MKHLAKMFYLVLLAVALQNCTENDNATIEKEKVQFSLDLSAAINGRVSSTSIPVGTSLRVSIQRTNGETISTLQKIELLQVGGVLISEPIELAQGSYRITDFLLVNTNNEISFAAPKRGSLMAPLVKNPIDFIFGVKKGQSSNVAMEVVNVTNSLPEDFGYVTFQLDIINPLKVAVYVPDYSNLKITTAQAYILHDGDTAQSFSLGAKDNILPFKEEPTDTCTLVIVKDGYAKYSNKFVYHDLAASLAGGSLKITLTPAFTFLAYYDVNSQEPYNIEIGGTPGTTVNVDWGDGISEVMPLDKIYSGNGEKFHSYSTTGRYFVSITGNLKAITDFKSFYGHGSFDRFNPEQLTNLTTFIMGLSRSPVTIDFTHNNKLSTMQLTDLQNLTSVTLPVKNALYDVDLTGPGVLNVSAVNYVISRMYNAAVSANRHGGSFEFKKNWWSDTNTMVKNPSSASLTMLRSLRDTYGWTINPNP